MENNCTYYWDKIAILHFADKPMEGKLELAQQILSKDELDHLKKLMGEN